jgi:hypothetical protein
MMRPFLFCCGDVTPAAPAGTNRQDRIGLIAGIHKGPLAAAVNIARTCVNIFSWINGLFDLLSFGTK